MLHNRIGKFEITYTLLQHGRREIMTFYWLFLLALIIKKSNQIFIWLLFEKKLHRIIDKYLNLWYNMSCRENSRWSCPFFRRKIGGYTSWPTQQRLGRRLMSKPLLNLFGKGGYYISMEQELVFLAISSIATAIGCIIGTVKFVIYLIDRRKK